MIEGKKLEYSRYLGGDLMLSILICDDDTSMVAAMRATTESVLRELAAKAKIHTFTDADSISKQTGYEVRAFRYILKRDLQTDLNAILPLALKQLNQETLPIQVNGEIIKVPLDDILYLEVQQHNVTVVTRKLTSDRKQKEYDFYASLTDLEERLEPLGFLRIHKSYLVNMKHLKKFQCREATLDNGMILRVGEKSYAENKQKFLLWKGWQ